MGEIDLANAIIAAALIQSGEFKLSAFDERGQPLRDRQGDNLNPAERLMRQADVLANPDLDWSATPALATLRKLTNTIRRALYEPPVPNPEGMHESVQPQSPVAPTD